MHIAIVLAFIDTWAYAFLLWSKIGASFSCRSVTPAELGVVQGLGAAQHMWYMGELNKYIAKMMLPEVGSGTRHFQSQPSMAANSTRHSKLLHARFVVADLAEAQNGGTTSSPLQGLLQDSDDDSDQQAYKQIVNSSQSGMWHNKLPSPESSLPLADEIGELYAYTASDLRAIAPLWWDYSKKMRTFHENYAKVCRFAWP